MGEKNSFENLNDENHFIWKKFMKALLVKRGLWDVVAGNETRPAGSDSTKAVRSFRKKQAEAVAEITLHVDIAQLSFIQSDDPEEVWDALEKMHQARGVATRLTTRRKFWKLEKTEEQSMQSFIGEARRLALELADIGVAVDDEDIILVITGGLPSAYDNFVVTLDSTAPEDLTLDYVVTRLLNEESRQTNGVRASAPNNKNPSEVAFAAFQRQRRPIDQITCYKCAKKGHYQVNCPDNTESKTEVGAYADAEDIW